MKKKNWYNLCIVHCIIVLLFYHFIYVFIWIKALEKNTNSVFPYRTTRRTFHIQQISNCSTSQLVAKRTLLNGQCYICKCFHLIHGNEIVLKDTDIVSYQMQLVRISFVIFPGGNYTFKVNNKDTRTRCEICSNLVKRHR